MLRFFRLIIMALILPLPGFLKLLIARIFLGWKIGRRSSVGWSWIDSPLVEIGEDTRIGHFNVFRNCSSVVFGNNVTFLNWNKIFGSAFVSSGWINKFFVGDRAYVTSNHFFDVAGGVVINDGVVVGGRDSQIWSHSIKIVRGKKELVPIPSEIGANSYLGARVTLVCSVLPPECIVGAGSVVNKSLIYNSQKQLIAGNPAVVRKVYSCDS